MLQIVYSLMFYGLLPFTTFFKYRTSKASQVPFPNFQKCIFIVHEKKVTSQSYIIIHC